jgi:raffinose/stachyose/melibiose transport system substrate-binding protein
LGEAAQYLDFLFSSDTQGALVSSCGLSPAPVEIAPEVLTGIDARQARLIADTNVAADSGGYGYTTWTFFPAQTGAYLIEQIESVWAGDLTTQGFLEGMEMTFAGEVAAGEVLNIPARGQ